MIRLLLRLVPTSTLQAALASREGVDTYPIEPYRQRTFKLCGPARVVVVRDEL